MTDNTSPRLERYPMSSGEWSPVGVERATDAPGVLWVASNRRAAITDARWLRQAARMNVCIARSSDEAAEAFRGRAPAFCVIELELAGGENGVCVLERLRRRGVTAPAVLLSASPEVALEALAQSNLSEVVPVFSRSERFDRLREWLDHLQTCCLVSCF